MIDSDDRCCQINASLSVAVKGSLKLDITMPKTVSPKPAPQSEMKEGVALIIDYLLKP
jgi:hypothetical protein